MKKLPVAIENNAIKSFCKQHHILSLALFGSVLTTHFKSNSDVDVFVKFHEKYTPGLFGMVDMETGLSSTIGKEVDLSTTNDFSSYFREEVSSLAQVIYRK